MFILTEAQIETLAGAQALAAVGGIIEHFADASERHEHPSPELAEFAAVALTAVSNVLRYGSREWTVVDEVRNAAWYGYGHARAFAEMRARDAEFAADEAARKEYLDWTLRHGADDEPESAAELVMFGARH